MSDMMIARNNHPSESLPAQMSCKDVVGQVKLICEIMREVMRENEHYGVIPGTEKPTLLKAGAEKLCLTFRLVASYKIEAIDLPNDHREYRIVCYLMHVNGTKYGEGVGICSTMESKFRYRNSYENTGKPVPQEYWKNKDQSLIGGKGCYAKKIEGKYQIVKSSGKENNPDIADHYNTVLKMAKKRAYVDAVISATAASDIFTQDIEESIETVETEKTVYQAADFFKEIKNTLESCTDIEKLRSHYDDFYAKCKKNYPTLINDLIRVKEQQKNIIEDKIFKDNLNPQ